MLNEAQKARLIKLAGHRVHHEEQILIMTCEEERFQEANKEKVTHHFKELLMQALPEPKQRITTKVPKQSKEARLSEKKREGQKK
jgi:ribosome-associated protein